MTRKKQLLRFIIPSLLGLFFFVVPLPYGSIIPLEGISPVNIGIGALVDVFKMVLEDVLFEVSLVVICFSALMSIIAKFVRFHRAFWRTLFDVGLFWLVCRVLGALFISMVYFGIGPQQIISPNTGGAMVALLPSLLGIFCITGYLLPLVVDFGLMDFFGTLISKYMNRLFLVPGRSAINVLSSWLGDGTLGIIITNGQYRSGYYTAKQASIIAVCFSLVSLPFSTVIAEQLDLMPRFVPFYGAVCLASFVCALIIPRLWPIRTIKNSTYNDIPHRKEQSVPQGKSLFFHSIDCAIARAESAPSLVSVLRGGLKFTLDLYLALLPLCVAWGIVALVLVNYTSFFTVISAPVEWLFELLSIPNAEVAAPAVLVGFADMFIPSVMVGGVEVAPITKFIIGALSISQLIYLTETGAVILKSSIPLNLWRLFVIYLLRTIISLPIIIVCAKLLY